MQHFDVTLVITALQLVVAVSAPVLAAALCGALIAGVLRVATQIDDGAISFVGRLAGVSLLLYMLSGTLGQQVLEFSARVWGGSDFYF